MSTHNMSHKKGNPFYLARKERADARAAVHVCGPTCKKNRKQEGKK